MNPQTPRYLPGSGARFCFGFLDGGKYFQAIAQIPFARLSQRNISCCPIEQPNAHMLLELDDGPRQNRRAEVQLAGRGCISARDSNLRENSHALEGIHIKSTCTEGRHLSHTACTPGTTIPFHGAAASSSGTSFYTAVHANMSVLPATAGSRQQAAGRHLGG
jgi:hypothetical protein